MSVPILLAALLIQAASTPAATDVARMAALYDDVCLQTFPIDGQVDAAMAKRGATPLTADQLRISLKGDPGRGWQVRDGGQSFVVLLELPPFHACSVRASQVDSGPVDLAAYRIVADRYAKDHRGFTAYPAMDTTRGGIHIHAEMQTRALPAGTENLMVIDQQIVDPKQLEPGTTSTPLRFVHQIVTKG